jgi:phosphoadenylyl-sulfate reductase (thioredoxin)
LPEAPDVELLTVTYGPNPFYQSVPLRMACCDARKVRPLRRALRGLDAWVTGLRRDQAATRAAIHKVEVDAANGGIVKINPLADWTEDAVWDYARRMDVPSHALYEQGYRSIGCAPCTRPVQTGEEARAGRWWWESDGTAKECGLHLRVRASDVAVRV